MAGYTRQDINNNISNGNVIDADDLDNEFNGVEAAFNVGSGHNHGGSVGEGAPITVIGPVQDIVASTTTLRPKTTNTVDLGTTTIRYKDAYLSGGIYAGGTVAVTGATTVGSTLDVTGNTSVGGNLIVTGNTTVSGNTTLGNAATDTVNFAADVASNLLPSIDDTYDLGAVGSEWRNLYIDGTANIDTAAVDTANVGTLSVSGNGTITGSLTVVGGINAVVTGTATSANTLTTARTIALGGDVSGSANFDGSANITITAAVDLTSYTGDVDITGELVVQSYNETFVTLSGTTPDVNCESGNVFSLTTSGNTTFTFSNPPATGTAYGFVLKVTAGGAHTLTWPASVDWAGGTAPDAPASGETDVFVFYTVDGGTNWYGFQAGDALA